MPDITPANATGITDQIARDYLRDRETACPRCRYSLRDAASCICPECGCAFDLEPFDPQRPDQHLNLIRFALLFLSLLALTEIIARGITVVNLMIIAGIPFSAFFEATYIGGLLVWIALFVHLILQWRRAKRGDTKSNKAVTVPAIIIFLVYTVPMIIQVATMFLPL